MFTLKDKLLSEDCLASMDTRRENELDDFTLMSSSNDNHMDRFLCYGVKVFSLTKMLERYTEKP